MNRKKRCPCCKKLVDEEKDLFVTDNELTYHYSCYNYMKAEKRDGKGNGK